MSYEARSLRLLHAGVHSDHGISQPCEAGDTSFGVGRGAVYLELLPANPPACPAALCSPTSLTNPARARET